MRVGVSESCSKASGYGLCRSLCVKREVPEAVRERKTISINIYGWSDPAKKGTNPHIDLTTATGMRDRLCPGRAALKPWCGWCGRGRKEKWPESRRGRERDGRCSAGSEKRKQRGSRATRRALHEWIDPLAASGNKQKRHRQATGTRHRQAHLCWQLLSMRFLRRTHNLPSLPLETHRVIIPACRARPQSAAAAAAGALCYSPTRPAARRRRRCCRRRRARW